MFKKINAIITIVCVIFASPFLFVSCSDDDNDSLEGINLVVILANRANMYSLSENDLDLIDLKFRNSLKELNIENYQREKQMINYILNKKKTSVDLALKFFMYYPIVLQ